MSRVAVSRLILQNVKYRHVPALKNFDIRGKFHEPLVDFADYNRLSQRRCFRRSRISLRDDEYYKILEVGRSATPAEIKKAYFAKAKQYHPDQNQGSTEAKKKFQEVTEAYEILGNPEKRQLYDQFGKAAVDGNAAGGNPFEGFGGDPFAGFSGMYGQRIHVDPQDIFGAFEQMFGSGGFQQRSRGPKKGQDLQIGLNITFLESIFGVKRVVNLSYKGRGKQAKKTKQVDIDIPAGVQDGMVLHLKGQGAEGDEGTQNGDLMIQVSVDEDPYFTRDGIDVHVEANISFAQAVLGSKIDILTLDGIVELTIPPGTSTDAVLLMRNKGIKRLHGFGKGNQYVHVKVEVPQPSKLSKEQRELIEKLHELERDGSKKPKGALASFSEKIQSALSRLKSHLTSTDDSGAEKKGASEKSGESKTESEEPKEEGRSKS